MTVAAMTMAAKKVCAQRSQRVAIRLQSLSLAKLFSILWRCLYWALSKSGGPSVRSGRDAGLDANGLERGAELVGVIALVADERSGARQRGIQDFGADVIGDLACRQRHDQRPSKLIGDRMQLGVQAAFGAADIRKLPSSGQPMPRSQSPKAISGSSGSSSDSSQVQPA